MRKVKVWRAWGEPLLLRPWYVDLGEARQGSGIWCATHSEAMFLAQLLADPHEYIRAAREAAYREWNKGAVMSQDVRDHLPALEAALQAWTNPGPVPGYHEDMKRNVRLAMPLLGRALDRAAEEQEK